MKTEQTKSVIIIHLYQKGTLFDIYFNVKNNIKKQIWLKKKNLAELTKIVFSFKLTNCQKNSYTEHRD